MRLALGIIAVGLVGCRFGTASAVDNDSVGDGSASGTSAAETATSGSSMSGDATGGASMSGGTTSATLTGGAMVTTASSSPVSSTADPVDGSSSSSESTGTPVEVLVDDGLVARYYLDEAPSGQAPLFALDAAPNALDLPIVYDTELNYIEQDGHRGLDWTTDGFNGSAQAVTFGTKVVDMLGGSTEGTIEVVFDSDMVLQSNNSSRYLSIGGGSAAGAFALSVTSDQGFWFRFRNQTPNRWGIDVASLGRSVVHLVLDTTQPEGDRAILYLDGVRQEPSGGPGPGPNEAIDIGAGDSLVIGNTQDGTRAGDQRIFYAALYAAALSEDDVANNAVVLLGDDDAPQ